MEIAQQMAAVAGVLTLLVATLWWLRGRGAVAFGRPRSAGKTLESLERLALSPQHTLHVVRFAGRQLLIGVSPAGCVVLDSDPRGAAPVAAANHGEGRVRTHEVPVFEVPA
jgi:flagellar biogenesis protein FliO